MSFVLVQIVSQLVNQDLQVLVLRHSQPMPDRDTVHILSPKAVVPVECVRGACCASSTLSCSCGDSVTFA